MRTSVICVYSIITKLEITPEIGTCLMTGIITDTGGFQYSAVSKETFEIAAELTKFRRKYFKNIQKSICNTYKRKFRT